MLIGTRALFYNPKHETRPTLNRYSFLLLFVLFFGHIVNAQQEAAIWYFGRNAGLDFRSGTPVPLVDGQIYTREGCATISDNVGNLLFYTDGISIWDRNHNTMPNGTGLLGDPSSSQSGMIVPHPGDPNLFYVFVIDNEYGPAPQ